MGLYHSVDVVIGNVLKFKRIVSRGPDKIVTRYDETTGQAYNKTVSTSVVTYTDWNGKVYSEVEYYSFHERVCEAFHDDDDFYFADDEHQTLVVGIQLAQIEERCYVNIDDHLTAETQSKIRKVQQKFDMLGIKLIPIIIVYHDYS